MPEVSQALAQSGELYFIHPLVINTENNHGYCVPLQEKDWKLIYAVPASTFLAQVKHFTQNAIFSTGIVFAIVVAVTWLLSVSLLRPIKRLTSAANEIANGNLDHPMVTKRPYKSAWSDRAAYDNIIKCGSYFDPNVVEAFKCLFEKGIFREIEHTYT